MGLIEQWNRRNSEGAVRFDPSMLTIRPAGSSNDLPWGIVFYSEAREQYKAEAARNPGSSFDPELMARMHLSDHGSLAVAANPNSLFEGHLVIYPHQRSAELTAENFLDIIDLARSNPSMTFIHNADRSAASITDWAHFQAYDLRFPIDRAIHTPIIRDEGSSFSKIDDQYPAYAVLLDCPSASRASDMIFSISEKLKGADSPQQSRIPLNFIWHGHRTWIIPRAKDQPEIAAKYFGGLELGGIFCLPNADELRSYLPNVLRSQVIRATLRNDGEAATREWFEAFLLSLIG